MFSAWDCAVVLAKGKPIVDLSKFEADGYAVIDGVVEIAQEWFLTPFLPDRELLGSTPRSQEV